MPKKKYLLLVIFLLISSSKLTAAGPSLNSINQIELDSVSKEFAANFTHTSVSPAKSLGNIFGIEAGLIAGITDTPKLKSLVLEVDPGTKIAYIPHAGAILAISVPFGITGELTIFPETKVADIEFSTISFGLKWTFSNLISSIKLLNLAIRLHGSTNTIGFAQAIQNSSTANIPISGNIEFKTKTFGGHFTLDADLPFLEPYAGIGFVSYQSDIAIAAAGNATIFDQTLSLSATQSADSSGGSIHAFLGLQLDLWLMHISGEYSYLFGTNKYSAKMSLYF